MNFTPQSDEELLSLLAIGEYDFEVEEAEDTVSKTGNQQIKLTLSVHDSFGKRRVLFDYLTDKLLYKLKHFCDATGLEEKYNAGTLSAQDCAGKKGQCKIGKQEATEQYQAKNVIKDYIKRKTQLNNSGTSELLNDEIPF